MIAQIRVQVDSQFGGSVIVTDDMMGPHLTVQNGELRDIYLSADECERVGKALMALAMLRQANTQAQP
jgi:hypothetical protein